MPTAKKSVKKKAFKVEGQKHVVDKENGKFEVHHPGSKKGTYTLPAKSLKGAEKAVKKWHSTHRKTGK
jgi:hypothetical protein